MSDLLLAKAPGRVAAGLEAEEAAAEVGVRTQRATMHEKFEKKPRQQVCCRCDDPRSRHVGIYNLIQRGMVIRGLTKQVHSLLSLLGCPSQARNRLDLINSTTNDLRNTASRVACRIVSVIVGKFGLRLPNLNDTSNRESAD